jgi:hypothetical protein
MRATQTAQAFNLLTPRPPQSPAPSFKSPYFAQDEFDRSLLSFNLSAANSQTRPIFAANQRENQFHLL